MRPNPRETADLVTFTEKIRNGKLQFLCSDARRKLATIPNQTITDINVASL